ncbi:MAG: deoxyribodipyrimidine photo-lyase [Solirubrobacterales bacterium]|nr:deoxyribodipyrimidine photo-lyase [Solirubrobacterales bacterium]
MSEGENDTASVMWFRRDLRTHDLPALAEAARAGRILPCFIFDDRLLSRGRFVSPRRTAFMLGCLESLRRDLRELGADLVLRHGRPEEELPRLASEAGAEAVHWTKDLSPFARARDERVSAALAAAGVTAHEHPGSYIVDEPEAVFSGQGRPYTVFSPFNRAWQEVPRRPFEDRPEALELAGSPEPGDIPGPAELGLDPAPEGWDEAFEPGEAAAREATKEFLNRGLSEYHETRNRPSGGSSRLSPWIRWGCLSPLELELKLGLRKGEGPRRFRDELAWREFYASVLANFPEVTRLEFQKRYRGTLDWQDDPGLLEAWKTGQTGYPLVDAGMRQLKGEGWMHNRLRMVVASFLTKDLHLDWREGERHFMNELLDGDLASNNGGWQWVASTGTDPAPYFQRMFNPMTQQEKFDPDGEYVRRWVPELAKVPDERLVRPWEMTEEEQSASGCRIGDDYPAPVIDHAEERRFAVERYRAAADQDEQG